MNTLKRLGIALWRTLLDQGDLIAMQVLLPPVAGAISKHVRLAVTGTHIAHEGPSRLASYRQAVTTVRVATIRSGSSTARRVSVPPFIEAPSNSGSPNNSVAAWERSSSVSDIRPLSTAAATALPTTR